MNNLYKIDIAILGISVVLMMVLMGFAKPLVIAPLDEYETSSSDVLFLIEKADLLMVDDNPDFTSPEEYVLKEGLEISLVPGKYYWKAAGVLNSEVRTFTINSVVNLGLRETDEGYSVINKGNVDLDVDVYESGELRDKVRLEVDKYSKIDGDKFIGGMVE